MSQITTDPKEHLKAFNVFLKQSDGRDKLTAAVQYAAMFVSAGEAGDAKKVQTSVAAARKVFRIFRPLEAASPVLLNPVLNPKKPMLLELINKLKSILMAIYFAGDHVVWASQAGLYTDKEGTEKAQKMSLWSWALGSVCTVVSECYELLQLSKPPSTGEGKEAWEIKRMKAQAEINTRMITLVHALFQTLLAAGLLQLRPMKPRTVGLIGVIASVMNCYMLYPKLPAPALTPPKSYAEATSSTQQPKMELKKA